MSKQRIELIVTRPFSESKGVLGGILKAANGVSHQTLVCDGIESTHVEMPAWKAKIFTIQAEMNGYSVHTHP